MESRQGQWHELNEKNYSSCSFPFSNAFWKSFGNAFGHVPNFHTVVPGRIYRGGQPTDHGLEQLARVKIQTILSLNNSKKETAREKVLVERLGMRFISVPLHPSVSPSDQDMRYIDSVLQDVSLQPLFVHCRAGKDRTGLVIGLYRVFRGHWSGEEAFQEMLRYGFDSKYFHLMNYFDLAVDAGGFLD